MTHDPIESVLALLMRIQEDIQMIKREVLPETDSDYTDDEEELMCSQPLEDTRRRKTHGSK